MIQRLLAQKLVAALRQFPVVGLVGSRQSGKTTLAKELVTARPGKALYLDLELPADLAKLADIGAAKGYLVTAGQEEFSLSADVWAMPLHTLLSKGIEALI